MTYINYHDRRASPELMYVDSLLRYRHLCLNLVGSDLRARFRRSRLGILWAVIQPLGYSLVIAWAYGALFGRTDFLDFALYVFSGMIVWEYFTNTINNSLDTLLNANGYLRQARIPFLVFQLRVPLTGAVIFCAGMIGLIVLEFAVATLAPGSTGMPPFGWHVLLIPLYLPLAMLFLAPLSIFFSVLGAKFHDLKHIMGLVLQALFFLSPVMMTRAYMDSPHLWILKYINPVVPLVNLFRAPVRLGEGWHPQDIIVLLLWTAAMWLLAFAVSARAGRKLVFAI